MTRKEEIKEAAYSQFCNSSSVTFTLQFDAFIKGAEWADKTMLKNACNWLKENKDDYAYPIYSGKELTDESFVLDTIVKDFRKAMEE